MATFDPRSLVKFSLALIALLALAIYAYLQGYNLILGPALTVRSPQNGQNIASTSPEVVVAGTAKNISFLTINGLQIFTDQNGNFSRKLLLARGYTIITVEAQDKFKRSITKELQLVVN